jgi:hypothetical protein
MKGDFSVQNAKVDLRSSSKPSKKPELDPFLEEPPWDDEENSGWNATAPVETIIPKKPELVFLPMLLQHAWMPPQGSPDVYVRSFRGLSFVSQAGLLRNGQSVGLPSGLQSRRLLLALVSQALINGTRKIDVSSISELMRWTGLTLTGRQHRKIQKQLFQLATANIDIWFSPTGDKAQIFKGVMFDSLQVDIVPSKQEKFSFIPNEVVFSESFFKSVIDGKAMPYKAAEVFKATSPIQHDLIMWLLHRQAEILKPLFLGYGLMFQQFGQPNQKPARFRHHFKKAVNQVIEKWDRKIEVNRNGIVLHPMGFHVGMKKSKWRLPVL